MNTDQFENRMILAMEGELSESEYNLLLKEIEANEPLSSMWNDYLELYQGMESMPFEMPSDRVSERFHNWLEPQPSGMKAKIVNLTQKDLKNNLFVVWKKWVGVAAVLICVFGFWQMYEYNQNVEHTLADVSHQMKTLMKQQSSTARIKAIRVNYAANSTSVNDKMIQVLIDVLNKDESSNVRLAAVETLANYMDQDKVREALIKRLAEEGDGGVKLSIITSLGQQQDENLKSTLKNIVNDDSQERFVIDEAHMQLIRYEKIDI